MNDQFGDDPNEAYVLHDHHAWKPSVKSSIDLIETEIWKRQNRDPSNEVVKW